MIPWSVVAVAVWGALVGWLGFRWGRRKGMQEGVDRAGSEHMMLFARLIHRMPQDVLSVIYKRMGEIEREDREVKELESLHEQ